MPKKYIDSRGWKYQVMPGLGENTFKARYQRPEKQGDVGWKGVAAVPWRGSREEAQTDLDQLAEKDGMLVVLPPNAPLPLEDLREMGGKSY